MSASFNRVHGSHRVAKRNSSTHEKFYPTESTGNHVKHDRYFHCRGGPSPGRGRNRNKVLGMIVKGRRVIRRTRNCSGHLSTPKLHLDLAIVRLQCVFFTNYIWELPCWNWLGTSSFSVTLPCLNQTAYFVPIECYSTVFLGPGSIFFHSLYWNVVLFY